VLGAINRLDEKSKCIAFAKHLEEWIDRYGNGEFTDSLIRRYKFNDCYKSFQAKITGIETSISQKESMELMSYWVIFYRVMRKRIPVPHANKFNFKYATKEDFLREYNYTFMDCDELETDQLFFTANWMALLFMTVDARGNKGLAMNVIPKVIEGIHVKYSTGGGQSLQTACRVRIYEHEGSVKPHERPTRKNSISASSSMSHDKDEDTLEHLPLYKRSFTTTHAPPDMSALEFLSHLTASQDAEFHRPQKRASIGPGTVSSTGSFDFFR
jgi:hypothetical protein